MAIVINGSGTVTGLAVGGLPDGTVDAGTLATDSVDSAELIDGAVDDSHMAAMAASKLSGTVATARMPTGSVLQVVSSTQTRALTTSSATYVTVGSLAITPSSTSSKIMVSYNSGICYQDTNSISWYAYATAYRGSTNLGRGSSGIGGLTGTYHTSNAKDDLGFNMSFEILDSPSTADAVTYYVKLRINNTNGVFVHDLDGYSTITLTEIAG